MTSKPKVLSKSPVSEKNKLLKKVKKIKVPKSKALKVIKAKKPKIKKLNVIKKLKAFKHIPIKVSMTDDEVKIFKKKVYNYKKNLLRNRPIEYILKNLNSKKTLSFYNKKIHK